MTKSKLLWGKFYWSDWDSDPGLRLCSMAAQGFWMRMLCICAHSVPVGYLAIAGNPLDIDDLARVVGIEPKQVKEWVDELERNGVFSRTRRGTIYSRRMVADEKSRKKNVKNGKNGGNPKLSKQSEIPPSDNPPLNRGVKAKRLETREEVDIAVDSTLIPRANGDGEKPKLPEPPAPANSTAQRVCIEVMRRCNMTRPPAEVGLILEWLKVGADPDKHIFPVVDEMFPKARNGVSSLKFFNTAVLNAIDGDRAKIDADIARWNRDVKRLADIQADTIAEAQRDRERAQRQRAAREAHAASLAERVARPNQGTAA